MLTLRQRISGLILLLDSVGQQARAYREFLIAQIQNQVNEEENDKAIQALQEPNPLATMTIEAIDGELEVINKEFWASEPIPSHLRVEPLKIFGPKFAAESKVVYPPSYRKTYEDFAGPGPRINNYSLARDYTGITVWLSHATNYLRYLEGCLTDSQQSATPASLSDAKEPTHCNLAL
jgi:hypothetical protein